MYELHVLKKNYVELGRPFAFLDFDSHIFWKKLFSHIRESHSTVIVDNTTVRNSLILMKQGLANEKSFHASLIPDFSIFDKNLRI